MILYHYTNTHVKESIQENGLIPMFDCVWMTSNQDLEMTAFHPTDKDENNHQYR